MVGGYQFDAQAARLQAIEHTDGTALAYIYDFDACRAFSDWRPICDDAADAGQAYHLSLNRLTLESSEMVGPDLVSEGSLTYLRMQPVFHLLYDTDVQAAELGAVHLLQSQRFVSLADGDRFELLEAEQPVLYLGSVGVMDPLGPPQQLGQHQGYRYPLTIQQEIPSQLNGIEVESVTVLEHYQSYFMQREVAAESEQLIWTPAMAPITWGWSIRVGRRADHEWGILRRKLILPTVGHDGLEFPLWEDNSQSLSRPLPAGR